MISKLTKSKYNTMFVIVMLFMFSMVGFAGDVRFVRVVDEAGIKVESFECKVQWKEFDDKNNVHGSLTWKNIKINAGVVSIDIGGLKENSRKKANGLEMLVAADGYGPEFLRCRFGDIPTEIKLEKSVKVILEKKNKSLAGSPVIVPLECNKELMYSFGNYPLKLKKTNSEKWQCDLKKGQKYVIGWKVKKGWFSKEFHAYCSEPFIAEKDGQIVNFEPGMPVTFKYDLSKAPKFLNVKKYPVRIRLDKVGPDDKRLQFSYYDEGIVEMNRAGIAQIPNLAAGNYYLTARTSPGRSDVPQISDIRQVTVKDGKEYVVKPVYPVLDTKVEPGDVSIKGVVLDAEQKPIANKQVSLWMQRSDEKKILITSNVFYEPAKTNSDGKFEFLGVMPGREILLTCLNESVFLTRGSFSKNAEVNLSFVIGQKDKFITVGKPFAFPEVRLNTDKQKSLNEFKGKIIIMDIWASWCSPCIRLMPKLNTLAKEMQSEDIQFVTLSVDGDSEAWKKRLAENNWQSLLHTWLDDTINDHKLRHNGGIPYYVIIDQEGIVRVAGNGIDVKTEIKKIQKAGK